MKKLTPYQLKMVFYIIIGIMVLVALYTIMDSIVDGFKGLFGIEEEKPDFSPVPLPTEETHNVSLTPEESKLVRAIAQRLHRDMDGVAIPGMRDTEVYEQLLELTDPLLVAVYNDFGLLYYSEGEGTLRQWLNSEQFWYTFSIFTPWGSYQAHQFTEAINQRFDLLNLQ